MKLYCVFVFLLSSQPERPRFVCILLPLVLNRHRLRFEGAGRFFVCSRLRELFFRVIYL